MTPAEISAIVVQLADELERRGLVVARREDRRGRPSRRQYIATSSDETTFAALGASKPRRAS